MFYLELSHQLRLSLTVHDFLVFNSETLQLNRKQITKQSAGRHSFDPLVCSNEIIIARVNSLTAICGAA
jgi:hypothetical protein